MVYLTDRQGQTDTEQDDQNKNKMSKKTLLTSLTDVPTYQDLFSLQDVLLWQLGGRASCVHRVADEIRIHRHYTSTKIITPIIPDLKISTWARSTHVIVSLLRPKRAKSETGNLHLM